MGVPTERGRLAIYGGESTGMLMLSESNILIPENLL